MRDLRSGSDLRRGAPATSFLHRHLRVPEHCRRAAGGVVSTMRSQCARSKASGLRGRGSGSARVRGTGCGVYGVDARGTRGPDQHREPPPCLGVESPPSVARGAEIARTELGSRQARSPHRHQPVGVADTTRNVEQRVDNANGREEGRPFKNSSKAASWAHRKGRCRPIRGAQPRADARATWGPRCLGLKAGAGCHERPDPASQPGNPRPVAPPPRRRGAPFPNALGYITLRR